MHSVRNVLVLVSILVLPGIVAAQGMDTTRIDQALGRSGQKTGDVYKVGFPRTDCMFPFTDWRSSRAWHLVPGLPSWGRTTRQWSWVTWFCWRTS